MKSFRIAALGVALATGSALAITAASPAMAQKKKEEKQTAAQKPKPSSNYVKAATPLEKAVQEKRYTDALPLLEAAKAVATTNDDKYYLYSSMAVIGSGNKNNAMMEEGMKGVLDTGFASPEQAREYNGLLGVLAYQRDDHPTAIGYFEKATQLGNTSIWPNLGEAYFASKQYDKAVKTFNDSIAVEKAAGRPVQESWYKRVNAFAMESGNAGLLATALENWLVAYPTADNWRAVLVNFRDSANLNSSTIIDLYRLMRQTGSLKGEKDYVEYADELFKSGQYGEASQVIEEGFSKGDIPSSSVPGKELRTLVSQRMSGDKASLANEAKSISTMGPGPATKIANAFLSHGDYAEAERLYGMILGKPGADADEINSRLGISSVMTGKVDAAKGYFEKVQNAPRSGVARFWLLWMKQKANPSSAAPSAAPAPSN